MDLSFILPSELSLPIALVLLGVSFLASMLTAAVSLGGGVLMMAVLTLFFPPAVLLPLHGAIQFGSNGGRALVQRAHIQWQIVIWVSLGALLGSALGVKFAALLPEQLFKIVMALFILFMTWLPLPKIQGRGPVANFTVGAILAFAGMIIGIIGPLVMTYLRHLPDRQQLVATHASILTAFTIGRMAAFAAIGFAFWSYLPFILGMIIAGFLGTLTGSRFLNRLPEQTFRVVVKYVITALALLLLYRAF